MSIKSIITIDIAGVNVKSLARINADDVQPFSNVAKIKDNDYTVNCFVTGEPDLLKLDGSYTFLKPNNNDYFSKSLSNDLAVFATPIKITATISQAVKSAWLKIFFGDTFAKRFNVEYFLNNVIVSKKEIINYNQICLIQNNVSGYDKIEFTFFETDKPFRFLKIIEIDFGEIIMLDDKELMSAKILDEFDFLGDTLTINTIDFMALNYDQQYNLLNPNSVYKMLEKNQKIKCKIIKNETEEINLGTFYLNTWENTNAPTATLTGEDIVGLFDDYPFKMGAFTPSTSPINAGLKFDEVLTSTGFKDYVVDTEISTIKLSGYINEGTARTALQDVCIATMSTVKSNRNGSIRIFRPLLNGTPKKINMLISNEKLLQKTIISGITCEYFTLTKNAKGEIEEVKQEITYPNGAVTTTVISGNHLITNAVQANEIAKYWFNFLSQYILDVEYQAIIENDVETNSVGSIDTFLKTTLNHLITTLDINVTGGYIATIKGVAKNGS
ncbi:MAG: hypothetical protein RR322_03685 [Oscillospiraceae bacterium]